MPAGYPRHVEPVESILTLAAGDGAKSRIHLDGGHVLSWVPAGETEDRLFVSPKSGFGPGVSIRGGVPICFPQFGTRGALPAHGFARVSHWSVVSAEDDESRSTATLALIDNDATRVLWPHAFRAELTVTIGGAVLDCALSIRNTGDAPFAFTAALHPYFRMHDALASTVEGVESSPLAITGAVDRIYYDVAGPVTIRDEDRTLRIEKRGFDDIVVWNPGEAGVAQKTDFHTGDERKMLCVEPAVIGRPVSLGPGELWTGVQRVRAG